METLTDERHPEGLINPMEQKDWETALTVILHSPHWTKRVTWGVSPMQDLPLHVAYRRGVPIEVVTALLEAYPDATKTRNAYGNLPCHTFCFDGTSSEAMKMLLRCNPDAAYAMNDRCETPLKCLNMFVWGCSNALLRRLIGGVPCADQWQGLSLVGSWISMI
jgi:hypothetical protein